MSVQWDTLLGSTGLSNGQTDTEDGVGTKLGLVGRAIELVQELVDLGLVLDVDVLLDESWSNDGVDILDGLGDAYALLAVPLIGIMRGRGRRARLIPFPSHLDLSPSRSSQASC